MKRYRLAPEAKQDLDDIFEYVAIHGGLRAAERLIDEITSQFLMLGHNPGAGRARDEIARRARSFPVGNYVIYYRRSGPYIEVARVLHGNRDQQKAFDD